MSGKKTSRNRPITFACLCSISLILQSCTVETPLQPATVRGSLDEQYHLDRFIVMEQPPIIAAQSLSELELVRRQTDRLDLERLRSRSDARQTASDALPFLSGSSAGRQFLNSPLPRALARGMPAEICPASFSVSGSTAKTRSDVAAEALSGCLTALSSSHPDCGCRLVALDTVLTVPRSDVGYATGIGARLYSEDRDIDLLAVAEDAEDGSVLLRDLNGLVATMSRTGSGRVELVFFETDEIFSGRSEQIGYRRGRIAERIYVENDDGERISLLIGFDPSELAADAARWLSWPGG